MKKFKRILAMLLVLTLFAGDLGLGGFPAPAVYADVDVSNEETPAPAENTPAPVENTPAPVENTPAPVENTPAPVENTPAPVENTPAPVENTPAPVENTPAPVEQTPAPELDLSDETELVIDEDETELEDEPDDPASGIYRQRLEKLEPIKDLEMTLEGKPPRGAAVVWKETKYLPKGEGKTLLYRFALQVFDAEGAAFRPSGPISVELKSELIRRAIDEGRELHVVYTGKHAESKILKAEKDTITFKIKKFDLICVYI